MTSRNSNGPNEDKAPTRAERLSEQSEFVVGRLGFASLSDRTGKDVLERLRLLATTFLI